jgi:hypothetical protein
LTAGAWHHHQPPCHVGWRAGQSHRRPAGRHRAPAHRRPPRLPAHHASQEETPPAVEESDSAPESDRRVTAAGDADDAPTTTAGGKSLDTVIDLKSDEEDADAGTPPDARGLVWSGVTVKVPTRSGEKTILADCAGSCAVGQVREWDERSHAHTRTHAALSLRVPRFAPTAIDLDRRCAYSTPPFGIYPHVPSMPSRQK